MNRLRRKTIFDHSWRSDPNAVFVGRPSRWGNPYKVGDDGTLEACLQKYREYLNQMLQSNWNWLEPLRGKNLVCYCPLDQPCHADIIIERLVALGGGEKQEEQKK